jgi:carbon-monoxide dehydrogenase medium subunit
MVIRGLDGERVLAMEQFHLGPYRTAVRQAEMLVEIRVALTERQGSAYEKVDRRVGDWAVAAAGASVELAADGRIQRAGVGLAAVGAEITSTEGEQLLLGQLPSDALLATAARAAGEHTRPVTDQRGSAEYKRHVAGVLVQRALKTAVARAQRERS